MPLQHELENQVRPSVTLTVAQIRDLACMAGLTVARNADEADEHEEEVTIEVCSPNGVDDDGTTRHYRHIAYFEDYPEEGVCPLGPEIAASSDDEMEHIRAEERAENTECRRTD